MFYQCKMCGGTLEIKNNDTVGVCEYCGTKQTLPRLDNDKKTNLYERAGKFRQDNDYDAARLLYEQILAEDKTDAEAYWSIVLCRYGIEYVEDQRTKKRIPTVNRAQYVSVFNDPDYNSAIKNSDAYQREIYEQEADKIDKIQKQILQISTNEEPFDVFICYKETDDKSNERTLDSVIGYEIYKELTHEGYKVFFSRVTLEDKLGQSYEPYIFAALNSSKVMIVIGTKPEYLDSAWVKNEWSRFLVMMRTDRKKYVIPVYRDMNPNDFPKDFSMLQAQDMSKIGAIQDIARGVAKLIGSSNDEKEKVYENIPQESFKDRIGKSLKKIKRSIRKAIKRIKKIGTRKLRIAAIIAIGVFSIVIGMGIFFINRSNNEESVDERQTSGTTPALVLGEEIPVTVIDDPQEVFVDIYKNSETEDTKEKKETGKPLPETVFSVVKGHYINDEGRSVDIQSVDEIVRLSRSNKIYGYEELPDKYLIKVRGDGKIYTYLYAKEGDEEKLYVNLNDGWDPNILDYQGRADEQYVKETEPVIDEANNASASTTWNLDGAHEGGMPDEIYEIVKGTYYSEINGIKIDIVSPYEATYESGTYVETLNIEGCDNGDTESEILFYVSSNGMGNILISMFYTEDSKVGMAILDGGGWDYNKAHVSAALEKIK